LTGTLMAVFLVFPNCSAERLTVYPDDGKIVNEFGRLFDTPVYPSLTLDQEGSRALFSCIERKDIHFIYEEEGKLHVQYTEESGGTLAVLTRRRVRN